MFSKSNATFSFLSLTWTPTLNKETHGRPKGPAEVQNFHPTQPKSPNPIKLRLPNKEAPPVAFQE